MSDSYGLKFYWKYDPDLTTREGLAEYTWLAGVVAGEMPKPKKNKYEKKALDQADRSIRFRGSFVDEGTSAFKFEFDKATYAQLLAAVHDPDVYPVKVVVPDAEDEEDCTVVTGHVLFEDIGMAFEEDGGRLVADVNIQWSGPVVYTPGS